MERGWLKTSYKPKPFWPTTQSNNVPPWYSCTQSYDNENYTKTSNIISSGKSP